MTGSEGFSDVPGLAAKGSGAAAVRVYLVDDHEIVRRGLRELLELEPDVVVVGESGSADEAARRIPAMRPDVAVLDARLPDGSGIEVCRQVRAVDPTTVRARLVRCSSPIDAGSSTRPLLCR